MKEAGLPDSEQVKSMVSSIWIVADNLGGYAGSTLGQEQGMWAQTRSNKNAGSHGTYGLITPGQKVVTCAQHYIRNSMTDNYLPLHRISY